MTEQFTESQLREALAGLSPEEQDRLLSEIEKRSATRPPTIFPGAMGMGAIPPESLGGNRGEYAAAGATGLAGAAAAVPFVMNPVGAATGLATGMGGAYIGEKIGHDVGVSAKRVGLPITPEGAGRMGAVVGGLAAPAGGAALMNRLLNVVPGSSVARLMAHLLRGGGKAPATRVAARSGQATESAAVAEAPVVVTQPPASPTATTPVTAQSSGTRLGATQQGTVPRSGPTTADAANLGNQARAAIASAKQRLSVGDSPEEITKSFVSMGIRADIAKEIVAAALRAGAGAALISLGTDSSIRNRRAASDLSSQAKGVVP